MLPSSSACSCCKDMVPIGIVEYGQIGDLYDHTFAKQISVATVLVMVFFILQRSSRRDRVGHTSEGRFTAGERNMNSLLVVYCRMVPNNPNNLLRRSDFRWSELLKATLTGAPFEMSCNDTKFSYKDGASNKPQKCHSYSAANHSSRQRRR